MDKETIIIKPAKPFFWLFIAMFFMGLGVLFFLSPYRDQMMFYGAIVFFAFGTTMLIVIDRSFSTISYDGKFLEIVGYFSMRNKLLKTEDIEGYELHQMTTQYDGLHYVVKLIVKNEKKIIFPKVGYSNYELIESFFNTYFEFLGKKKMKHGELISKWLRIMGLVSGILYLLGHLIRGL